MQTQTREKKLIRIQMKDAMKNIRKLIGFRSRPLWDLLFLGSLLMACTKEEPNMESKIDQPLLFVIAGQSNAEGAVFWQGLEGLQNALPTARQDLGPDELTLARSAVAQSLGVFCEVPIPCVENPETCTESAFSLRAADVVIRGLQNSTINWRELGPSYQNTNIRIRTINYRNANPVILDPNGQELDNENCQVSEFETVLSGPLLDPYTTDQIQPLGLGLGAESFDGSLSFGPEIAFGLKIAQSVKTPTLLKMTMGGSTLNDTWRQSGTLYQSLITETQKLISEENLRLGGVVWFQGFNDQFEDAYCNPIASKYEANLRRLLSNLREDLSAPDLPVIIVQARNEGELFTIQRAQSAVAAEDPWAGLVVTEDLSNCFHYCSGSQIIIGERAGLKMQELLRE